MYMKPFIYDNIYEYLECFLCVLSACDKAR